MLDDILEFVLELMTECFGDGLWVATNDWLKLYIPRCRMLRWIAAALIWVLILAVLIAIFLGLCLLIRCIWGLLFE